MLVDLKASSSLVLPKFHSMRRGNNVSRQFRIIEVDGDSPRSLHSRQRTRERQAQRSLKQQMQQEAF